MAITKKKPTDVELCCAIILNFYKHPPRTHLSIDDIFDEISLRFTTTKEDVLKTIEALRKGYLCSNFFKKDNEGNLLGTWYCWSIARNENGGVRHEGNLFLTQ